jgi:hypothetical protein
MNHKIYLPYIGSGRPAITPWDMLPYMRGDGRIYEVVLFDKDGNQHQARHQTLVDYNLPRWSEWYQTKNHEWEELAADGEFIYRGIDTSPGNGEYYDLRDDDREIYSRWCPRFWAPGDIYERNPRMTFFRKSDCYPLRSVKHHTWLSFTYQFPSWPTPLGDIEDVIQLDWLLSPDDKQSEETYWYARGWGLVGWASRGHYAVPVELHQPGARPDNVREVIPCLENAAR